MRLTSYLTIAYILLISTLGWSQKNHEKAMDHQLITLTLEEANRLAAMPITCLQQEYPNKLGQRLEDASHLKPPKELHPAFYGCYDWHSSVHGHWSLVSLLRRFPDLDSAFVIRKKLATNISKENVQQEVEYFSHKWNRNYERTYGWAWLLKLQEELYLWDDPLARELHSNLTPLVDKIEDLWIDYLGKLVYPVRVGTHTNTAFGLSFAHDYATRMGRDSFKLAIEKAALRFYQDDQGCPITWEPSGNDFLSPCLEEIDIMSRVLPKQEFDDWLSHFMPELAHPDFELSPGIVGDRSDGHLVHLDGLNFSRAWCLLNLANTDSRFEHLRKVAQTHIHHSLPSIVDDNYSGTHWLASFAINALYATK